MDTATVPAVDTAAPTWEDPPRRAPAGTAPVLSVDGFEGPLDWLLEMARAQKIDLARLSILALVDAFATAMQAAFSRRDTAPVSLARWGDWLVMATTLTQLRSRLLLPADAPAAKQARSEAEALRQHLVGRVQMRAAADWLDHRPQLGRDVFARGRPEISASPGRVGDITELLRACLVALRVPEAQVDIYRPRPPPLWSVSDAIARMERLLPGLPGDVPLAAFLPRVADAAPDRELRCKAAVASTLVASLELARGGDLALHQDEPWTPIQVQPRDRMLSVEHTDPVARADRQAGV